MQNYKNIFLGLMIFVAVLNGVFGSSGIATLCLHGFDFIHIASAGHDQESAKCGSMGHCEASKNSVVDFVLTSESLECEEHCTHIELKALENEYLPRTGIEKTLPALSFDLVQEFVKIDLNYSSRDSWFMPPMRGPPSVNMMTELCIKKTVLRL